MPARVAGSMMKFEMLASEAMEKMPRANGIWLKLVVYLQCAHWQQ